MARRSAVVRVSVLGDARDLQRAFDKAAGASRSFADRVRGDLSKLGGWAANAAKVILGIGAAIAALTIKGGISRALNIEDAQAKLRGLGHDTKSVERIMESALDSVRGTAFGLDAAAGAAAAAVAAGIEPGRELTRVLKLTGDAATIMGRSFNDSGRIINKILASNRVTMEEVNQLHDAGLPILSMLADQYGVTALAMRDMVSRGEVDSARFLDALETNVAGAALKSGETTRGAFANMGAAFSRLGATLVEDFLPLARDAFGGVIEGVDSLTKRAKPAMEAFARSDAFATLQGHIERIPEYIEAAVDGILGLWEATGSLREAFGNLVSGGLSLAVGLFKDLGNLNRALGGIPGILAAIAGGLALIYAHPVIGGLAAVAIAIGTLTKESREARQAARDLAEEYWELGDAAERAGLLGDFFTPEQLQLLDQAGVKISDLVDGTISWEEAERRLIDGLESGRVTMEGTGLSAHDYMQVKGDLILKTREMIDAEREHTEALVEEGDAAREAGRGFDRAGGSAREWREKQREAREATEEGTDSIEAHIEALQALADEMRAQTDPIFGLIEAQSALTEAQDRTREAVEEYGEGSDEHIEALTNEGRALADLRDAHIDLEASGVAPTRSALRDLLTEYGYTRDEADLLIDKLNEVDAVKVGDKTFRLNVDAPIIEYSQSGQSYVPRGGGHVALARGGIVTGPTAGLIGEAGSDEAVIPLNSQGVRVLAAALGEAIGQLRPAGGSRAGGPGAGDPVVINVTVHALDPSSAARAVVEALQTYERNNGPLPIRARGA